MSVNRFLLFEKIVNTESDAFTIEDIARMRADGIYLKLCFLSQYVGGETPPTIKLFGEESFSGDNVDILAASFMNIPEFGMIIRGDEDVKSLIIDNSAGGCVRFLLQVWRYYCE